MFVFQCKEDAMMARIKDAEHSQLVAEMRRRVAELEIEVKLLEIKLKEIKNGDKLKLNYRKYS